MRQESEITQVAWMLSSFLIFHFLFFICYLLFWVV